MLHEGDQVRRVHLDQLPKWDGVRLLN
jgi:hypothetical protein